MPSYDNPKNINTAKTIRFIHKHNQTQRGVVVPSKVATLATRNMNSAWILAAARSAARRATARAMLRRLFSHVLEILCIAVHCCAAVLQVLPLGDLEHELEAVHMAHMAVKSQKSLRMNLAELQDPSAARVKQCLLGWR